MSDPTAYREPGVRLEIVEEGYASEQPVVGMPPIFIGPCFQILDKVHIGTYDKTTGMTEFYPDLITGAKVDTDSAKLFVVHGDDGLEVEITDGGDGATPPVFGAAAVTAPGGIYNNVIENALTGRRAIDGLELSDSAEDFSDVRYGDLLVMTDNDDEAVAINQMGSGGALELLAALDGESILYFDTMTTAFNPGATLTQAISGATARILDVVMVGLADGFLVLGSITGSFDAVNLLSDDGAIPGGATSVSLNAQAGVHYYLGFENLVAPGAISVGDVLEGVPGANEILNGDFPADLSDWTAGAGWAWAAGAAAVTAAPGNGSLEQTVTTFVAGRAYHIEFDIVITIGTGIAVFAGGVLLDTILITGSYSYNFIAAGTGALIFTPTIDVTGTVDNVTCGTAAGGVVRCVDEVDEFVLLGSVTGTFVDGENLNVGAATVADAVGTQILFSINIDRQYEIRREIYGEAYIWLRALRNDYANTVLYIPAGSKAGVIELAGGEYALVSENPLIKAAELAVTLGSDCYLIMVDDLAGALDPKNMSLSAWSTAFDLAKDYLNPYAYVPLIQNDLVLSLMEVHLNWKRDPDNFMREVVGYYCPARVQEDIAIDSRTAVEGFTGANTFKDAGISSFISYGCLPGRYLEITDVAGVAGDAGEVYIYKTLTVTDDTITTVDAVPVPIQAIKTYRYINEYFDLAQEAIYIRKFGQAYQNKAIRLIHPATFELEREEVPGYYMGVIRAAQLSINDPQHIYTGERVPILTRAFTPFVKREHLNEIASGGIQVYIAQTSRTILCRDSITSDRTLAAREEEHAVTSIDFAARYIRAVFLPQQGRYHMDDMLEDGISVLAGGCEDYLVSKKKILGRLTLIKYSIDEDEPRLMNFEFAARPRFSNKWSDITLRVVSS